jgi:hypothetical protein
MVPKATLLKYNPLKVFGIGELHAQHPAITMLQQHYKS